MKDERGEGRGRRGRVAKSGSTSKAERIKEEAGFEGILEQIEYLLYLSTQGIHFLFDRTDIRRVLSTPPKSEFYTEANRKKVQALLTGLLDAVTLAEKRSFLESRSDADFELLVRAYFQLVDKAILAHSNIRH